MNRGNFTNPTDVTATIPANQAEQIHNLKYGLDPEYRKAVDYSNMLKQFQAQDPGLQDASLEVLPFGRGLGAIGREQQALAKAAAQAKTAELFRGQELMNQYNIMTGRNLAAQKGLGRLDTLQKFKMQDALRNQAINNGITAAALKQDLRRSGQLYE